MRLKYLAVIVLSVAAVVANYLLSPPYIYSDAAEPPAKETNAPGENNCTSCHSGTIALKSSDITVSSSPTGLFTTGYTAGQAYTITYTLSNTAVDYGFEITCLNSTNNAAGTFALINTGNTTLQSSGGRQYVGHKNANATFSWTFTWTAPASGTGAVTFYAVGLLGNGNGTDQGDQCKANTFVVDQAVTVSCNLTASISSTNVSCNGGKNGSATVTPTNGTSPYNYVWSNNAGNTTEATGLSIGAISVTVTDANSCTATSSITITQPTALATTITHTGATCNLDNGSASVTASGGTSSYKYLWSTNPVQTTSIASNIGAGEYTVTVTDANNCSLAASVSVTNTGSLPDSIMSISGATTVCPGAEGYSVATQTGTTYTWALSGGGNLSSTTGSSISVTWASAGSHTLSVTPSNSCGSGPTSKLIVTVNDSAPGVSPVINGNTSACLTQNTYTLTRQIGITYTWALSGGGNILSSNDSTAIINWDTAGTYTLSVTPSNTCGSGPTGTLTIIAIGRPSIGPIITGDTAPCANRFAYTIIPVASLAYTWSLSGGGNIIFSNDSVANIDWDSLGAEVISVTPSNICGSGPAGTLKVVVNNNVPATPAITGNDSACIGTQTLYSVNTQSGVTYNWYLPGGGVLSADTGSSIFITWDSSGNHTISMAPSSICGIGDTATFIVAVGLGADSAGPITGDTSVCINTTQSYSILAGNANSYNWSVSGGGAITPNISGDSAAISWTNKGVYTIMVDPVISCGYGTPGVLTVTVNGPPQSPAINGQDTICVEVKDTFSVVATAWETYVWSASDSNIIIAQDSQVYVSWANGGEKYIRVTASNTCGTSIPDTQNVLVMAIPQSPEVLGPDSICFGSSGAFSVIPQVGATYIWNASDSGTVSFNYAVADIYWSAAGQYNVSVTSANSCGNSVPQVQPVKVYQHPPINIGNDTSLCGAEFELTAPVYNTYLWSTGSTTNSTFIGSSNTYSVTVTDDSGCVAVGKRYINFSYIYPISLPDSAIGCDSVTVDPGAYYNYYSWSNGDSLETLTAYQSGLYTVTVTLTVSDTSNCQESQSVQVRVDQEPLAGFTFSVNDLTVSFTDTSTDPVLHRWDFGDGDTSSAVDPVHVYSLPGLYHVILTVVNACNSNSYLRSVDLDTTTGINVVNSDSFLDVYPNPVTDRLIVISSIAGDIELLNETGEEVFKTKVSDSQPLQVDMSELSRGLYLVRLTNGDQTMTKKVVKL